ncbi:unnamed protein product, partial [Discosporangium mesarthrocarpum]
MPETLPCPLLPPSSPLWDPEARVMASGLALARPDHVVNEGRRQERLRNAWHSLPQGGGKTKAVGRIGKVGAAPAVLACAHIRQG